MVTAMYHYLPSDEVNNTCGHLEQWPSLNFLNHCNRSLFRPQTVALTAAVDTFGLAQAAIKLNDDRLVFASLRRYGACLSALSYAFDQATASGGNSETLLCVLVLQTVAVSLTS